MPDLLPPAAALPHSLGPYVALILAGFAIGGCGHLFKARWLTAAGITLIVVGALLLPFAGGVPRGEESGPGGEGAGLAE